jgi:pilus assembly protein CpaF
MDFPTLLQFFPAALRSLILADDISDVMVNEDGLVFVDRNGRLEEAMRVKDSLVMAIQNVARMLGSDIDAKNPILDTRLSDGSRVAALYSNGAMTLTIRKFNRWYSTDELVVAGCLPPSVRDILIAGILGSGWRGKVNILVAGGTSSGKTTLAKALIDHIPADERLILIEKPREMLISHRNAVRFEAQSATPGGRPEISIGQLLVASLRHRPDRIILGEVREPVAAYQLLQALNTGHSGSICTIHSDSAEDAFHRLVDLVLASHSNLRREFVEKQVLRSIDFIVHLERIDGVRRVTELVEENEAEGRFVRIYPATAIAATRFSSKSNQPLPSSVNRGRRLWQTKQRRSENSAYPPRSKRNGILWRFRGFQRRS